MIQCHLLEMCFCRSQVLDHVSQPEAGRPRFYTAEACEHWSPYQPFWGTQADMSAATSDHYPPIGGTRRGRMKGKSVRVNLIPDKTPTVLVSICSTLQTLIKHNDPTSAPLPCKTQVNT